MPDKNYYEVRINKALAFINENLSNSINISQIAEVAHFSPFHFQRLYKSLLNESPYETLLRLRLEKSVFYLKHHKTMKISDVALKCGFESPENFSRQFKSRFKISPSNFRKDKTIQNSRIYQEEQKEDFYHYMEINRYQNEDFFEVKIERLPELRIAFVRAIFGADGSGLVERYLELIKWAETNQLIYSGPLKRFGMSIDSPDVTPVGKYRYDFALRIDDSFKMYEASIIEDGLIAEGEYATLHVKGKLDQVSKAWDYLYRFWLPESNYIPGNAPALEEFIQGPEEIGWENFNIKCRIPLEKIKAY